MDKFILEAGISELTKAIEQEPTATLFKERGRLKMLCGDQQGAIADFGKAAQLDPSLMTELCGKFDNK